MKLIRIILLKIFGLKGYIRLISKIYIFLIFKGFLKKRYPEIFFLKELIKSGFTCIDIGANVGYYSVMLSKLTGQYGKVLAVEPISLFIEIWEKNVRLSGFNNLQMFPFALGGENKTVQMGIPVVNGIIRHGMTTFVTTGVQQFAKKFDVEMKKTDELFAGLERLDFIKCDVEGFESEVFGNMKNLISKFKPVIQSELTGTKNRESVICLLKNYGYSVNILGNNGKLIEINEKKIETTEKDFYFVPG
ncbi:MAG: FkbM family methyltransferase, partial [Bacteroidia bacterium]|nr:FkbM family methyltransferase [Bacteroidia bacterium]